MSSVPSDLFSSATPDEMGSEIESSQPEGIEIPEDAPEPEAPVEEPVEEPEAEPQAEPEPPADDLPEGVRHGKDRSGKEGLWVEPSRWATIYDNGYKVLKQFEQIAGGPLTEEAFKVYNRAYMGQERLFSDLLSGEPESQGKVLQYFLEEGARALGEGEIGKDPAIPLAQTFYDTIKTHPEAYANLRMQAARDLVNEMYEEFGKSGNRDGWISVGHLANALGMPYRKAEDLQTFAATQADPLAAKDKRIQELETQLNGRQVNNQAAQLDQWANDTKQKVTQAVLSDAVSPALAETKAAWEKVQGGKEAFAELVEGKLHSAVRQTLKEDARFLDRIKLLDQNARRAPSAQKRAEYAEQIRQTYVNRAKLAVDALKPGIMQDAARFFKAGNDANHQRRQAAQSQRTPQGTASPVPRSIAPANLVSGAGDRFDPGEAARQTARLIAGM
jgi:hypothetical protein